MLIVKIMVGAIIDIVSNRGAQNEFLTQNPEITFFKQIYRRYSNFSEESIEIPINLNFGTSNRVVLPISGDFINKMYLSFQIPAIELYYPNSKINDIRTINQQTGNNTLIDYADDLYNIMRYYKQSLSDLPLFIESLKRVEQKLITSNAKLTCTAYQDEKINNTYTDEYRQLKHSLFKLWLEEFPLLSNTYYALYNARSLPYETDILKDFLLSLPDSDNFINMIDNYNAIQAVVDTFSVNSMKSFSINGVNNKIIIIQNYQQNDYIDYLRQQELLLERRIISGINRLIRMYNVNADNLNNLIIPFLTNLNSFDPIQALSLIQANVDQNKINEINSIKNVIQNVTAKIGRTNNFFILSRKMINLDDIFQYIFTLIKNPDVLTIYQLMYNYFLQSYSDTFTNGNLLSMNFFSNNPNLNQMKFYSDLDNLARLSYLDFYKNILNYNDEFITPMLLDLKSKLTNFIVLEDLINEQTQSNVPVMVNNTIINTLIATSYPINDHYVNYLRSKPIYTPLFPLQDELNALLSGNNVSFNTPIEQYLTDIRGRYILSIKYANTIKMLKSIDTTFLTKKEIIASIPNIDLLTNYVISYLNNPFFTFKDIIDIVGIDYPISKYQEEVFNISKYDNVIDYFMDYIWDSVYLINYDASKRPTQIMNDINKIVDEDYLSKMTEYDYVYNKLVETDKVLQYQKKVINENIKYAEELYDTLSKAWISVKKVLTRDKAQGKWIKKLGLYLIDQIKFSIGDQTIDVHDGSWLDIITMVTYNDGLLNGFNEMIGNIPSLFEFSNRKDSYSLYIPLQFFFNKSSASSLPIGAILYNEVAITIQLKNFNDVFIKDEFSAILNEPRLLNIQLATNYVFVDEKVRQTLFNNLFYVIDTVSYNICPSDYVINSFDGLVSWMAVIAYRDNNQPSNYGTVIDDENDNDDEYIDGLFNIMSKNLPILINNYGTLFPLTNGIDNGQYLGHMTSKINSNDKLFIAKQLNNIQNEMIENGYMVKKENYQINRNPFDRVKLELNGSTLLNASGLYLGAGIHFNRTPSVGVNLYSFALHPLESFPSGTINLSLLDFRSEYTFISDVKYVKTYVQKVNFLRVMSGMAAMVFD